MKAYEKYLNEEKDRLVEVHTDWLKEIDNYIKCLEYNIEQSELNYLKDQEIFIERLERLESRIKELEKPIELKIDADEFKNATFKSTDRGITLERLRGDI
ncbi:hypothetical protein A9Q68_08575 [Streptococcus bovimastitidis]|uniref:Uncharacterized protein n=1 Tax=Streptococcus bovimastitidis TaxID=1856638 RepID=A0A1L8MKF6_9STRE|nr:hypothetical protein [Streptococcus bovimastitidis]OJF71243.1 hypothetical protein A9Q68_08575 [Streptococcus bovimastitidis]